MPIVEHHARTGCIIGDAVVVLDTVQSRYFLAPQGAGEAKVSPDPPSDRSILLSWDDDVTPCRATAREHWISRVQASEELDGGRASLRCLLLLRLLEWRYTRRLQQGLAAGLELLSQAPVGEGRSRSIANLISSAHRAQRLWTARDRCLPRSLALAHALRAAGEQADVVLGVMLHPFAAHAWVQSGDAALNDAYDHVTLFTPILVA